MRNLMILTAIVAAAAAGYLSNEISTTPEAAAELTPITTPEPEPTVTEPDIPESAEDARTYADCSGFWRFMAGKLREYLNDYDNAAALDTMAKAAQLAAFEVLRAHAGHGPIASHRTEFQQATEWADAEFSEWVEDSNWVHSNRQQHDLCLEHSDRMTGLALMVELDRHVLEPLDRIEEIEREGGAVWFVEPVAPSPLPR